MNDPQNPTTTSKPPAGIDQHSLGGPDHEESNDEAADDIDGQSSVGKDGAEFSGGEAAQQISQVGADNGGDGYGEEIFHANVSYKIDSIL